MVQKKTTSVKEQDESCCPKLPTDKGCDYLDFRYRLTHHTSVKPPNGGNVAVEVIVHARLERCPGELSLGDVVYSTTLLPGERVRLFTADRRNRFSFDSSSQLSYRHEQTSEERYYMSSMSTFMSDLTVREVAQASSERHDSFSSKAGTSGILSSLINGPSVSASGSYNGRSTSSFLHELRQHAQSSHNRSIQATRAISSVSVGEVQTRQHSEGESESHFESASRQFSNQNKCHAVTYLFYQLNKTQTIKFHIISIEKRVIDPAAGTRVTNRPYVSNGDVEVIPTAILATNKKRLELEESGRASVSAKMVASPQFSTFDARNLTFSSGQQSTPIPATLQDEAIAEVEKELRDANITEETIKQLSFVFKTSIPTPGIVVKGCLDKCNTCEPQLQAKIKLDLERQALENEMLKKQIELLEKSQEYRCCPETKSEEAADDA
jgi:hypothetical protein